MAVCEAEPHDHRKRKYMKPMKILVLGDVSRSAGTEYVAAKLWKYRKENEISLVIVNGETAQSKTASTAARQTLCFPQARTSSPRAITPSSDMMRSICLRKMKISCALPIILIAWQAKALFFLTWTA